MEFDYLKQRQVDISLKETNSLPNFASLLGLVTHSRQHTELDMYKAQ